MKNRKIEIRIEKRERIIFFRSHQQELRARCPGCKEETVFILPEQAAAVFALSMREIFQLIEASCLHFIETETRATFVCLTSLESLTIDPPAPTPLILDEGANF